MFLLLFCPPIAGETVAVAVQPAEEVTARKKPVMKQRRVVVTGMGLVTPLGHEPDVFYNNLLEGVSGISEIETFDCAQFPTVNCTMHIYLFSACSTFCSHYMSVCLLVFFSFL